MLGWVWLASLLIGWHAFGAEKPSAVTLLLDIDGAKSASTLWAELRSETERIYAPTELMFRWRTKESRVYGEAYAQIVVIRFRGACRVQPQAFKLGSHLGRVGPLGSAIVEKGEILPFAIVDCDRVLYCLAAELAGRAAEDGDRLFGRALARVLAHELYHILAATHSHAKTGVAKADHSLGDLVADSFEFEAGQLEQLRVGVLSEL